MGANWVSTRTHWTRRGARGRHARARTGHTRGTARARQHDPIGIGEHGAGRTGKEERAHEVGGGVVVRLGKEADAGEADEDGAEEDGGERRAHG